MRLDIFRRAEQGGNFSYLAIPEGKEIPQEATNIDWEVDSRGIDLDDGASSWDEFAIRDPLEQIRKKGYAISNLGNNGSSQTATTRH